MNAFRRLFRYVKRYKWYAMLAPLFMCLEVAMDLLQPMLMQHMIDVGIAHQDHTYVLTLGIYMVIASVIGLFAGASCIIFSSRAAVNFATDVRRDLFWKIERLSKQKSDDFGVGKLITIATNDISVIQQAFMMTLRVFVRGPLLFIGSVIIVSFTARELFPVLFVAIPLLLMLIYGFSALSSKLFANVQQVVDRVNTRMKETLAGIRVIKAFGRQTYEIERFRKVNDELTKRNLAAEQVILSLMPILFFIINVSIVAGLWIGVMRVNEGTLEVGVILAFINYLNIIMMGLMSSSHVLMLIARSFISVKRVVAVLDAEQDIERNVEQNETSPIRGDIEFRNVSFGYYKDREPVLKHISFKVNAGEKVGIIGATGSGKSTLVKLLPRLYEPDSGEILLDGRNVKEYPLKALREAIGFVPQKATLFSGTIEENLRFGKEDATMVEMEAAAESAAATEFIVRFEDKFAHELQQGAANLSGGQKQRLTMARAFIRKPKILILDDSTSAIDALSEAAVQRALQKNVANDTTVFIVSSKISSMIDADKIIVLHDGTIENIGTHEQLLSCSDIYRQIFMTQTGNRVVSNE